MATSDFPSPSYPRPAIGLEKAGPAGYALRVVSNAEGNVVLKRGPASLWLLPSPLPVVLALVFVYVGGGFVFSGVRSLHDGAPGAAVGALLGAVFLGSGLFHLVIRRPIHVDVLRREVRILGGPHVPLGQVEGVSVEPNRIPSTFATVVLRLRSGMKICLGAPWPTQDRAELLARHLAGLIGCSAETAVVPPRSLIPIPADEPFRRLRRAVGPGVRWARIVGYTLALVGGASFLSGFLLSLPWADPLGAVEFPLADPQGIAVDAQGRIYVGSRAYRRIQRYHADGSFDRSFQVRIGKGTWELGVDERQRLHVRIGAPGDGTEWLLVGDEHLVPLAEESRAPLRWGEIEVIAPDRSVYAIRMVPPAVLRTPPLGDPVVAVDPGLVRFAVASPLPAWLIAASGILVLLIADRRAERASA